MAEQTFTQKLQRLEEIVSQLERPDVELEDGLRLLEEGVLLHQECQRLLTQTQAKITKLLDAQNNAAEVPTHDEKPEQAQHVQTARNAVEVSETTLFSASGTIDPVDISSSEDDGDLPF